MLNKCELKQEHISSFQEPKTQISLNRRTQIPQRTLRNSCSCLEAFPISQNNSPALPSPLPPPTDLKIGAETSPLFFFFFLCAECLGGRAWTHCQALGLLVFLVSWWSWEFCHFTWAADTDPSVVFFTLIGKLKCLLQLGRGEIWQPHWIVVSASEGWLFPSQASQGRDAKPYSTRHCVTQNKVV